MISSARGEIPTAGAGDTSSSLAGGSPATPAESPAEPHSHRATHRAVGPTPSHQPSPETADGAESMASGTAAPWDDFKQSTRDPDFNSIS